MRVRVNGADDQIREKWVQKGPCDEADQERLAMEAQDGANKGKKGLGVGSHVMSNPKNMAAGSNW